MGGRPRARGRSGATGLVERSRGAGLLVVLAWLGCGDGATGGPGGSIPTPEQRPDPAVAEVAEPTVSEAGCPRAPLGQRIERTMIEICEQTVVDPMAQDASLDTAVIGHWTGEYVEEDGRAYRFEADLAVGGGHVGGSTTESDASGPLWVGTLRADVTGDLFATGQLVLLKTYRSGSVTHSVLYVGMLDATRARIEGHWRVHGRRGTFWMTRQ